MKEIIEFILSVWNVIQPFWDLIKSGLALIGDICLFCISIYTFRLTVFPKKLNFISFQHNRTSLNGDSFEIVLENRSLSPVVILSIDLLINSYKIAVFNGNKIIEGFKTEAIQIDPYTDITDSNGKSLSLIKFPFKGNLLVQTSRGIQYIKYKKTFKINYWLNYMRGKRCAATIVHRNKYGDNVVAKGVKYVLTFVDKSDIQHTIFIHKSGMMSGELFGYNAFPKEIMKNETTLYDFLTSEFSKYNLFFQLEVLDFPMVQ